MGALEADGANAYQKSVEKDNFFSQTIDAFKRKENSNFDIPIYIGARWEPVRIFAARAYAGAMVRFCRVAGEKLRTGGRFVCVYLPDRLPDLFHAMREAKIEPKRTTVVAADPTAIPSLVLVEGRRGGAPGMKLTRPLFLYANERHDTPSLDMQTILDAGNFPYGFGDGTAPKEKGKTR